MPLTTNVTLRQLRAIVAIEEHGKINSAARAVGLTAPAVTLQLKQLEEDAGVMLFDRTSHGMRPTIAGHAFLAAAHDVLSRLDRLDTELDEIRGVRKGKLTVGVASTAGHFAPQLSAAFAEMFPDIDVELLTGRRAETMARLRNYEADLVLTARLPSDVSVRAMAFAEYRLVVVAAPTHPLAARRSIPKSEVLATPFLIREPGSGPRNSFERFLGGDPDRLGFHYTEMDSNQAITRAVIADLGLALVASHTVAAELEAQRLVVLDVEGLPDPLQWFSITRSDRAITPLVASFQQFLVENGARYLHVYDAHGSPETAGEG